MFKSFQLGWQYQCIVSIEIQIVLFNLKSSFCCSQCVRSGVLLLQVGQDSPAANRLGDTVASVIEDLAVEQARVRSFREKIYREPQFIAKEKVQMNADEWVKMMADPNNDGWGEEVTSS